MAFFMGARMADLDITGRVVVDASDAERGLKQVGVAADRMATGVAGSAKKAGDAVDTIGAGASKGADQFTRAEARIRDSIKRSTQELQLLGKTASEKLEFKIQAKGMDAAQFAPYLAELKKVEAAQREVATGAKTTGSAFEGLGSSAALAGRALGALGIAFSAKEFIKLADASTNVASRLGLVTSSAAELASVQQRLFGIAQASRVSFVDLVGTYAQVARSTKDLGVSQNSLLGVINTISQAVTISGGSAASAQAALTQLSQGFASGALRGEELNSILEQTPRLAQALADGLGVGVGKLRELGQAGELTSEKVLGALEKAAGSVDSEFAKMAVTVEGASTQAANSVLKLAGAFDKLTGTSSIAAKAIQSVSSGLDFLTKDLEKLGSQGPLRDASREVINLDAAAKRLRAGMTSGVLGPNAQAELDRINARLAEAKSRFRELDQQVSGGKNSYDNRPEDRRLAEGSREAARLAKLREDANTFRLNQSGVPASYLKDMNELIRLNQAGVIVGKEYTDALKKQQDELLKKTGVTKSSNAAASQEQNTYESLIASIRAKIEADQLELSGGAALTESQRIRIKLDQDLAAGRIKLGASREAEVRREIDALAVSEAAVAAAKTLAKATLDAAASREKYIASLGTGLEKIRADTAAQIESTDRLGLTKTAIAALDAAKLEMLATDLELQAIKELDRNLDQQTYDALKKQAQAYRELAKAKQGFAAKEEAQDLEKANADAAKKAADEWQKTADSINQTLTDALMRGFESGKDFAKNLRDTVVNMFKTMVLRPVISAIMSPISGALMGGMGLSGAASAGQAAGGWLSPIASGASLFGSAGGLFGGFGAGYASASSAASIGASFVGPPASAAGGAVGMGAQFSAVMPWLAGAVAIAALWKPLFGRTLKDSGIEGTFGGDSGFEGRSYKFYKGGLFRSDKTEYDALDEQVRKTLGDTFNAMSQQVSDFADVLGLSTARLEGFTTDIKLSTHGMSEGDAQKKLQEALETANNELAQQVIGTWEETTETIKRRVASSGAEMEAGADAFREVEETVTRTTYHASEFAREGEKAIDTLTRLATSLTLANTWFKRFGASLFDASLEGGDQASSFVDSMGGKEAFDQQAGSYFNNFYSSNQRRTAMRGEIEDSLSKAGVDMPRTAAEFKAAMYGFLAMGEAGHEGAAALFEVSDAFAEVNGSIGDLEQAMGVSADSLKGILDDVRKSATSAAEAKKMASQKFEDSIYDGLGSAMTQGLSQMIMSAVVGPLLDGLLAGATGSATVMAAGGVAGGSGVAAGGAAAGSSVAAGGAAAGAAMAQGGAVAGAAVASTVEQARAYMAAFADIMNDPAVRDTISQIADGFGDIAGGMFDVTGSMGGASAAMTSTGSSAASMGDSISDLGDSIEAENKRLRGLMVDDSAGKGKDFLLAEFTTATAAARAGDQSALERLPELSQKIEEATRLTAGSSVELARMRGWLAGSLSGTNAMFASSKSSAGRPAAIDWADPSKTPTYVNGVPTYTTREVANADSRYASWRDNDPIAGTGTWVGFDPNWRPDWRYASSMDSTPYLANPIDGFDLTFEDWWAHRNDSSMYYGIPKYLQGTNYVPEDGLAFLHRGEAVIPEQYNRTAPPRIADKAGAQDPVVKELRALRTEVGALRTQQRDETLAQQRINLRTAKVLERWERSGMPDPRNEMVAA